MSLAFLLDTNILSAPISKIPDRRIVAALEKHADRCAVPAPVWHELIFGCARLPAGRRRSALETYLHEVVVAAFPILPYDAAAAAWHGRERARLEKAGRVPPFVDGQIAAIAHQGELTLVTRNRRDFEAFQDLELTQWSVP